MEELLSVVPSDVMILTVSGTTEKQIETISVNLPISSYAGSHIFIQDGKGKGDRKIPNSNKVQGRIAGVEGRDPRLFRELYTSSSVLFDASSTKRGWAASIFNGVAWCYASKVDEDKAPNGKRVISSLARCRR